jgi:hypothetical protein
MSAFACDVVKIVSVSDKNTLDVVLHATVSRGECTSHAQIIYFTAESPMWSGGSHNSRREVIFARVCQITLQFFICFQLKRSRLPDSCLVLLPAVAHTQSCCTVRGGQALRCFGGCNSQQM